jgi:hypothetical protein
VRKYDSSCDYQDPSGLETALGGLARGFHHQFDSFSFQLPSTIACSADNGVPSYQSLGSTQKGKGGMTLVASNQYR